MGNSAVGFDCDRYRKLLAEANDERKRLALIDLLIEERAKDRLAEHALRTRVSGFVLKTEAPRVPKLLSMEKVL
jgi:hypothetical protein